MHPLAAGALGALGAVEAGAALAQRLDRTSEAASAEEIWAYGEICAREPEAHDGARARIARLTGLDPAAEVVRAAALTKLANRATARSTRRGSASGRGDASASSAARAPTSSPSDSF